MPLTFGTRLGPYEILSPLGVGGMGEVYRARDTRLGRDVALKVLPGAFAQDAERRARFEREARAVAALNHPNILAIYDIGSYQGVPFLVTELLEGETLRERLSTGSLPLRKALAVAEQAARGVAAAHERGIIHRDLKPANIFLTSDGRVKVLDFGLAKLAPENGAPLDESRSSTVTAPQTQAGMVLGTMAYMSPEQVRGKRADARSDVFAMGTILYEMLSGRRAFERDSSADTMAAILKEDPAELSGGGKKILPAVERVVRHCLEKNPAERFQSMRDLAFNLQALSDAPTTTPAAPVVPEASWGKWLMRGAAALAVIAVAVLAFVLGEWKQSAGGARRATYLPVNYQPEMVFNARFAPDGETVVYSAAVEGNVPQLKVHRPDYPAPNPVGSPATELLSISSKGELAVLIGAHYVEHRIFTGTLARMDLSGGAPRAILQNVQDADWVPDGSALAIIREVSGHSRLEYPIGKVLYETAGYVSDLRFSPRGDQIAFFEHPIRYDNRGSIDVVDLGGRKRVLAGGYGGEDGLAWAKDGSTIYFSSWAAGESHTVIHAVTLTGPPRTVLSAAEDISILDTGKNGDLIAKEDNDQFRLLVLPPGAKAERDLTWLDESTNPWLSADGQEILFTDENNIAGTNYALLLRKTDGSPVVRLGDGTASGLSPDGLWALSNIAGPPAQLVLYPTGAGEKRVLEPGLIQDYESAQFFPDGKRILACGSEPGHLTRCYVQDVAGGAPRPVTPEATRGGVVSPDGQLVLAQSADGKYALYPLAGGSPRMVPGMTPQDVVIRWNEDGRSVWVFHTTQIPARVEEVALSTGRRTLIREIAPADRAGVVRIMNVASASRGKSLAYSYEKDLSTLTVIEGVK
jgi:hypothetical protein